MSACCVPRGDATNDPDRLAQPHREGAGEIGRAYLARRRVGSPRGLAQEPGSEAHLEHPEAEACARLTRQQRDDLVAPAPQDVGGPQEETLSFGGRRLGPSRKGRRRGLDGPAGVLFGPRGNSGHDLPGVGVEIVEHASAAGLDPVTPDELTVFGRAGLRLWTVWSPRSPPPCKCSQRSSPIARLRPARPLIKLSRLRFATSRQSGVGIVARTAI
jgi:hypothetical protein